MNPVPLVESATDQTAGNYLAIAALILFLVGVIGLILCSTKLKNSSAKVGGAVTALGSLAVLVGLALAIVGFALTPNYVEQIHATFAAQNAGARAEIERVYGLELTEAEVEELMYPYEDPETDFMVFGSIEQREQIEGAQFEERTIYLVWADDELQLSESEDGKSFSELKPTE
jgi:hypothetical protein